MSETLNQQQSSQNQEEDLYVLPDPTIATTQNKEKPPTIMSYTLNPEQQTSRMQDQNLFDYTYEDIPELTVATTQNKEKPATRMFDVLNTEQQSGQNQDKNNLYENLDSYAELPRSKVSTNQNKEKPPTVMSEILNPEQQLSKSQGKCRRN